LYGGGSWSERSERKRGERERHSSWKRRERACWMVEIETKLDELRILERERKNRRKIEKRVERERRGEKEREDVY
jgi:hypothetical protein